MKRPFHVTIAGDKASGAVVSTCVWATNKEQLFFHLQTTIMCNKNIEIFDVEKNQLYDKEKFIFSVCKSVEAAKAFFYAEREAIYLDHTVEDCQFDLGILLKKTTHKTKLN